MRLSTMVMFVIGGIVGAFVGWNVAQPGWAKDIQTRVVETWNSIFK